MRGLELLPMKPLAYRIDYSQYGQPDFFRRFVPEGSPRWLVDVGAHDGVEGSNSRGLIVEGWDALLVEPLPQASEALRKNSTGFPKLRIEQCACADYEGVATFHLGTDGPGGQSSSLCEDDVWKHNHVGETITVDVKKITTLLDKHTVPSRFALLLVDAEGMDLEVLQGLDFSRYRPAVICTEVYEANPTKDERKAGLLLSHRYEYRGRIGSDAIWSDSDFDESLESTFEEAPAELLAEVANLPVTGQGVMFIDHSVNSDGIITIQGWAMAPNQTAPRYVFVGIQANSEMVWRQSPRCVRKDVGLHFGKEELVFTGFRASFPFNQQGTVSVTVVQADGGLRWDNTTSVVLRVMDQSGSVC